MNEQEAQEHIDKNREENGEDLLQQDNLNNVFGNEAEYQEWLKTQENER